MKFPSVAELKATVRERDGNRCTECGMTAAQHLERYGRDLDVHRLIPGSPYTTEGCVTLCRRCHGSKPKRPRGSLPWVTVKIPRGLMRKALLVAKWRGISICLFLDQLLRSQVNADYQKLREEIRQGVE